MLASWHTSLSMDIHLLKEVQNLKFLKKLKTWNSVTQIKFK